MKEIISQNINMIKNDFIKLSGIEVSSFSLLDIDAFHYKLASNYLDNSFGNLNNVFKNAKVILNVFEGKSFIELTAIISVDFKLGCWFPLEVSNLEGTHKLVIRYYILEDNKLQLHLENYQENTIKLIIKFDDARSDLITYTPKNDYLDYSINSIIEREENINSIEFYIYKKNKFIEFTPNKKVINLLKKFKLYN